MRDDYDTVFEYREATEQPMTRTELNFRQFHTDHPDVYDELVRLARALRERGFNHYGIKSLFEVMRYHRTVEGTDVDGFKMNNNYAPLYARMIMDREPDLIGFFKTRALRTAR